MLPSRFGGGPTDYPVLETEDDAGQPLVRLVIHPRVGPVDPELAVNAFLDGIGRGSGADRLMGLLWRTGRFVGVDRRPTLATPAGKILQLHRSPRLAPPSPASS